jgi:hypothetical protein
VDQDSIRERQAQRIEDCCVDGSDNGGTFVTLQRDLVPG